MRESQYQNKLIKKLNDLFPGCVIVRNDPRHIQGIPDILILYHDMWAGLEIKMSSTSSIQPNQEYYVNLLNGMSFASFINPDNEEDVLNDLQRTFGFTRATRLSQS
jgi:hypothetical protein